LEKVPVAPVAQVEGHRIAGHQPPHYTGERCSARFQQQVKVIVHQSPGQTTCPGFCQDATQPFDEMIAIGVASEDLSALDPPSGYVMQRTRRVYPGFSSHAFGFMQSPPKKNYNVEGVPFFLLRKDMPLD
jgi:hypothetical protein